MLHLRSAPAIVLGIALFAAPAHAGEKARAWAIENRSPASAPASFAANELRRYLALTSGEDDLVRPGEAGTTEGRIVVGLREDLDEADRALLPDPEAGVDGYAVSVADDATGRPTWIIAGDEDRGTLYGVYDVLERVGWRWFHPQLDPRDAEVRPQSSEIELEPGSWAVASPMKTRSLIWYVHRNAIEKRPPTTEDLRLQLDWIAKARYNTVEHRALELPPDHPLHVTLREEAGRRGLRLQTPGHNFDRFLPNTDEAFAEHPEWFGERAGARRRHTILGGTQFCWSNEEAIAVFLDNVEAFVRARPHLSVLTMSALDGGEISPCDCELCAGTSVTDRYLALMNRVAERLAGTAPEVQVEAIVGYQHVEELPKAVEPHPRLRGRYARWGRTISLGFSTDAHGEELRAWSGIFDGRLTVYLYYSDHFAGPALAPPVTTQMLSDRAVLLSDPADGMLNLVYPRSYWWRASLNAYLAGRVYFDASENPTELLVDYARRYYGPQGGSTMVRYYTQLAKDPSMARRIETIGVQQDQRRLDWLEKNALERAAENVRPDSVFAYRLDKERRWHRLAQTTAAPGLWLRTARRLARQGKTQEALVAVERASALVPETEAAWIEADERGDGLADKGFLGRYRRNFDRAAERARAVARGEPEPDLKSLRQPTVPPEPDLHGPNSLR